MPTVVFQKANDSWSQPAPSDPTPAVPGEGGCCHPGCCDGDTRISSRLAQQVPPHHQPARAARCTEELLCFCPDVGQPGTEIFNMPAITGAGNSPTYTCTIPHPLQGSQPRRAGVVVDLSISFLTFAIRLIVAVAGRLKPRDTP